MQPPETSLAIITPVFNDWSALTALIHRLDRVLRPYVTHYDVIAVDDGSLEDSAVSLSAFDVARVTVLRLACNMGDQRALAVGLVEVLEHFHCDIVIVMDADGEDRPEDVPKLLQASIDAPKHVICATRASRTNSWFFKLFYRLYKIVFRQLTGAQIDFGNFCAIPKALLPTIAMNSGIWNYLAATLVRSRVPIIRLPLDRGQRIAGKSRMNFVEWLVHGFSAISVFADVVLVRVLVLSMSLAVVTIIALAVVVALRWFTTLAIPGWASNVVGSLLILLFQSVIFGAISLFMLLSLRSAPAIVPRSYAPQFIVARLTSSDAARGTLSVTEYVASTPALRS
jgi:polyisoprenyl-phosphate glycosyltransferase